MLSRDSHSSSKRFRRDRHGVVIARWAEDTALVRTDDDRTVEVEVPEALREGFDVGAEARLDGVEDRIVGWGPVETR